MSNYPKHLRLRAKLAGLNRALDIVARLAPKRAMAGCLSVSQAVASAVTGRARFKSHTLLRYASVAVVPGGSV